MISTVLRVLVVEDQEADAELMIHELRRAGFAPDWQRVDSEAAFLAALETKPDLILSDYNLPGWNGLLALQRVRENALDVPFILASGAIGEEQAVAAMKAGASDYLLKDRLARLGPAVVLALEQRSTRQAKRQAESQLRTLLETLPAGAYTCDRDGLITFCNQQAVRIWGRTPKLLDPVDRYSGAFKLSTVEGSPVDPSQSWIARALRENTSFLGQEIVVEQPDGKRLTVLSHASPIHNESGEVVGGVNVLVDITERKKLEEQLRQAQRMEAIGQLAGGVAHDFNNLLTVITGYSEVILQQLPQENPCWSMLLEVMKAGERATALTRQLLAFSRKQVLALEVVDLNFLVTGIERMLHRLIGEDIDLVAIKAPDLHAVRADPGQIEQILLNLAVNARDAMPQGGKLTIETANVLLDESHSAVGGEVQPGAYAMLAMSDTGCGMDQATQAHIFEPFFTTKGPNKGTGLGLATVFGIVKQSGGFLHVSSEPGQGATFEVYLPRVEKPPEPDGQREKRQLCQSETDRRFSA